MSSLTHISADGTASMVDVSQKPVSTRQSTATGRVRMAQATLDAILQGNARKGDVIGTARIAAIASITLLAGLTVSAAAVIAFLSAPVLGAIADFSSAKKRFLLFFAYSGALAAALLYFCRPGDVFKTLAFFLLAQLGFVHRHTPRIRLRGWAIAARSRTGQRNPNRLFQTFIPDVCS